MNINFNLSGEYQAFFGKQQKDGYNITNVEQPESIKAAFAGLDEVIAKFETGNMTFDELVQELTTYGVAYVAEKKTDNYTVVMFECQGKQYAIACATEAAEKSDDDKQVAVYTTNDLKKTYKLTDEEISTYFDVVEFSYHFPKYALKANGEYKTISELLDALSNKKISALDYNTDPDKIHKTAMDQVATSKMDLGERIPLYVNDEGKTVYQFEQINTFFDKNGRRIGSETTGADGKKKYIINKYDENGKLVGYITYQKPDTDCVQEFDTNWNTKGYTQYKNGVKTSSTTMADGKTVEQTIYNEDGSVKYVNNNYRYSEAGVLQGYDRTDYDKDGNVTYEETFTCDENGVRILNVVNELDKNGNVVKTRVYDIIDNAKFVERKEEPKEENSGNVGNPTNVKIPLVPDNDTEENTKPADDIKENTTYKDGVPTYTVKTKNGKVIEETIYNADGSVKYVNHNYRYSEAGVLQGYDRTNKDKNGNVTSEETFTCNEKGVRVFNVVNELDKDGNVVKTRVYDIIDNKKFLERKSFDYKSAPAEINKYLEARVDGTKTKVEGKNTIYFDGNGNRLYYETTAADGKTTRVVYKYDKDNKVGGYLTYNVPDTSTIYEYDTNWKQLGYTQYKNGVKTTSKAIADGKTVEETIYRADGSVQYVNNNYRYSEAGVLQGYDRKNVDKNGNVTSVETFTCNEKGVRILNVINELDKNGNVVKTKVYDIVDGKFIERKPLNYMSNPDELDKSLSVRADSSKTKVEGNYTIYFDRDGNRLYYESKASDGKTQITVYKYDENGKHVGFVTYKKPNKDGVYEYDTNWKQLGYSTYKNGVRQSSAIATDGKTVEQTIYRADGSVQYVNNNYKYSESGELLSYDRTNKDKNGKITSIEHYTYENGGKTRVCVIEKPDKNGKFVKTDAITYVDGKVTERVNYRDDGSVYTKDTNFEYTEDGILKGYQKLVYTAMGKLDRTDTYIQDEKGNNSILLRRNKKTGRKEIWTWDASSKQYRQGFDFLSKGAKNWYRNIETAVNHPGLAKSWTGYDIAIDFMYWAGTGKNPSPIPKSVYNTYQNYIQRKIAEEITAEYHYTESEIQGMYFGPTTSLSKTLAKDKDFKKFVKDNLAALKKGVSTGEDGSAWKTFGFKSNADLKNALGGVDVIKSWVDDKGQLHVVIADTYDFTGEGQGSGRGDACAGGDAAMKDGILKPFYALIEIVIDPKTL